MLADSNGFVYTDPDGNSITLNDDVNYPFTQQLNVESEQPRSTKRSKAQDHGTWPTFDWDDGMTVDVEGDIFGSDADDYNTKRIALVTRLRYRPVAPVRRTGTIKINFVGQSEVWMTDVRVDAFSAPITTDAGPNRSPYMITFYSFTPYFTGVTSGDFYYYS